jgi:DNA-directed RNA polymerase specialized sigma24 family protein
MRDSAVDWQLVHREVVSTLRARRADIEQAREIAQTAIERAIAHHPDGWTTQRAVQWSVRVALNASIDEHRRSARLEVGRVVDRSSGFDVERIVLARLEVEEVAEAIGRLNTRDRDLLLDVDAMPSTDDRARTRDKVARHRARARLRALIDRSSAWIATRPTWQRLTRALASAEIAAPRTAVVVALALTATAGGASAALLARAHQTTPARAATQDRPSHAPKIDPWAGPDRIDVPATESDRPPAYGRPGRQVANVDPDGPGGMPRVLHWVDDPEYDDDPIECAWSRPVHREVCTPLTWGDIRRVIPISLPGTPW